MTESGRKEWNRIVDVLGHHVLGRDPALIADYADALSCLLQIADLLRLRGAVQINNGEPVEGSEVQMLADAMQDLRRSIARLGIKQPLPERISVHRLTQRISRN
ncbi:MAG: hypothetical protein WD423_07300 [Rhodothermales bacterium]